MLESFIAGAWLVFIFNGNPSIPFHSFEQCQIAKQELVDDGWRKDALTCIHGAKK